MGNGYPKMQSYDVPRAWTVWESNPLSLRES